MEYLLLIDEMEKILWCTILAQSKRFLIEWVDIDFGNGNKTQFERVRFQGEGSGVMVLAIEKDATDRYVYLIEHFLVGIEQKGFVLPGGYWDSELSIFDAANKELKEEIWYGAKNITPLIDMELLPGYLKWHTQLCLATDLYPESLEGDEFEDMIVHKLLYADALDLIRQGKVTDARTIAWLLYGEKL